MSAKKTKRIGVKLDMTPMVDVAFLLLTFFMLTTTFKPPEEVQISLPSSHSEIKLPSSDILTISVGKDGRVIYGVDSQVTREKIFNQKGASDYISFRKVKQGDGGVAQKLYFSSENRGQPKPDLLRTFKLTEGFEINLNDMEQLVTWTRLSNPKIRGVIKADNDANYEVIEKIMDVFQRTGLTRFNLVTNLEADVPLLK
jgi:biopolymer transport protein ExbD